MNFKYLTKEEVDTKYIGFYNQLYAGRSFMEFVIVNLVADSHRRQVPITAIKLRGWLAEFFGSVRSDTVSRCLNNLIKQKYIARGKEGRLEVFRLHKNKHRAVNKLIDSSKVVGMYFEDIKQIILDNIKDLKGQITIFKTIIAIEIANKGKQVKDLTVATVCRVADLSKHSYFKIAKYLKNIVLEPSKKIRQLVRWTTLLRHRFKKLNESKRTQSVTILRRMICSYCKSKNAFIPLSAKTNSPADRHAKICDSCYERKTAARKPTISQQDLENKRREIVNKLSQKFQA